MVDNDERLSSTACLPLRTGLIRAGIGGDFGGSLIDPCSGPGWLDFAHCPAGILSAVVE